MDNASSPSRQRTEIQALIRIYRAMDGTAVGLASVALDGLDQSWRDRVQRIRALPREAPRRSQMIVALRNLIEHTLWKQRTEIEALRARDAALAADALAIAQRGEPAEPSTDPPQT